MRMLLCAVFLIVLEGIFVSNASSEPKSQSSKGATVPAIAATASPTPTPTAIPTPFPTARSFDHDVNTPIYIISDDEAAVDAAKAQEKGPIPTASPTVSPSPMTSASAAAIDTQERMAECSRLSGSGDKGKCREIVGKLALLPIPQAPQLQANSMPPSVPSPMASPSDAPGARSSSSSGVVADSLSDLLDHIQSNLIFQFERRGLAVVNLQRFNALCNAGPPPHNNVFALHWSLLNPDMQIDKEWQLFGYTSSDIQLYWHVTTCNDDQAVIFGDPTDVKDASAGRVYHDAFGTNFQVRSPTDFLSDIFTFLTLFHPGGHAYVAASFAASVTGVSSSLNTILNAAYADHDFNNDTVKLATSALAQKYCGMAAIACLKVR